MDFTAFLTGRWVWLVLLCMHKRCVSWNIMLAFEVINVSAWVCWMMDALMIGWDLRDCVDRWLMTECEIYGEPGYLYFLTYCVPSQAVQFHLTCCAFFFELRAARWAASVVRSIKQRECLRKALFWPLDKELFCCQERKPQTQVSRHLLGLTDNWNMQAGKMKFPRKAALKFLNRIVTVRGTLRRLCASLFPLRSLSHQAWTIV